MSKRRLSSNLFDLFPDHLFNKIKPDDNFMKNSKNTPFPTQEAPQRLISHASKIIMNKITFPPTKQPIFNENYEKPSAENYEKPSFSLKKSSLIKPQISKIVVEVNSETIFNFNPENIPNFKNFIEKSGVISPSILNLQHYFQFATFNRVQTQCVYQLLFSDENFVISAPTGSGKTVLFELAILKLWLNKSKYQSNSCCKIIYLSPIKALCQEKLQDWIDKFSHLGMIILELTGDSGDIEEKETFTSSHVIITTPEKWDSITRKWHNNEVLLSKVGLILIDEVHLLNTEERGATLEAVISRMKLLASRKNHSKLRIIALSATIPNIGDIALWLGVNPEYVKKFGDEYRPVALEKHVLGYNRSKSEFLFEKSLNYRLLDIIRKFAEKKPVLVFCQTQKGTMAACEQLLLDAHDREFISHDEHLSRLAENSSRVSDPQLKKFLMGGVAFHNARLKPEDRRLVENLFKERIISVICTTSTLAQGVNLPARLVIIKSTVCYRGAGTGYSDYSQLEIEQMMGRAGRPQYDNKGVVVIMTQRDKVEKFQNNFMMKEDLESHFGKKLAEHLNAEVALGSVPDLESAVEYLKSTFYFIRMSKNPSFYGWDNKIRLDDYIREICMKLLIDMQEYDLLSFDKNSKIVKPLDLGCEMSRYYVEFPTIKKLFSEFNGKNDSQFNLENVLRVLSQANEFERFRSKLEERAKLKFLNERNRYKIKGAISTYDKKTYVLLQSWIQRENIDDWEMMRDITEMISYNWRILSCFKKFFIKKKQPNNLICTIKLNKFISSRSWENNPMTILRQITGIGEKFAKILLDFKIDSFPKILETSNSLLESYCGKNSPFGENMKRFVWRIPNLEIKIKARNSKTISFEVENLHACSKNEDETQNEASNAFLIFFNKNKSVFLFKFINLRKQGKAKMEFDIHLGTDNSNLPLKIAILNEKFVGYDKSYTLEKDFTFKVNICEEQIANKKEINCCEDEKNKDKNKEEIKFLSENGEDGKNEEAKEEEELVEELLQGFYREEKIDEKKLNNQKMNENQQKKIIKEVNKDQNIINLIQESFGEENSKILNSRQIPLRKKSASKKKKESFLIKNEKEIIIGKNNKIYEIPERLNQKNSKMNISEQIPKNINTTKEKKEDLPANEKEIIGKNNDKNNKLKQKTINWFKEQQNYQEFYSLFEDIF